VIPKKPSTARNGPQPAKGKTAVATERRRADGSRRFLLNSFFSSCDDDEGGLATVCFIMLLYTLACQANPSSFGTPPFSPSTSSFPPSLPEQPGYHLYVLLPPLT
jgi:hypothetical protein